jgi:hypothetical protein
MTFTRLLSPKNGNIPILYYEIFVKNVTNNETEFTSKVNISDPTTGSTFSYSLNNLIINQEYYVMYRGVNALGPGKNSSP